MKIGRKTMLHMQEIAEDLRSGLESLQQWRLRSRADALETIIRSELEKDRERAAARKAEKAKG